MVRATDLKSGGLAMLVVKIIPWTRFFCNVHLFRVPRSWTGSVQMKSSMPFIRGYRCREREIYNFKSRKVKRSKDCALALSALNEKSNVAFAIGLWHVCGYKM